MIYVIYHENCSDGMAAATVAYSVFGDTATYITAQYNQEPRVKIKDLKPDDVVYVLDFSYPAEVLDEIYGKVRQLTVLDHHKTAEAILKDKPYAYFDMEKSGAMLAWEHFYPGDYVPLLIRLVQDRDLWKFEHTESRPLAEYIKASAINGDFEEWSKMLDSAAYLEECIEKGRALITYKGIFLKSFLDSTKYSIRIIDGKKVALYQATDNISDLGDTLNKNLDIDYSLSYFFTAEGDIVLNFRSGAEKNTDVSAIAWSFGGGGHRNAAGASVKYPESLQVHAKLLEYPTIKLPRKET